MLRHADRSPCLPLAHRRRPAPASARLAAAAPARAVAAGARPGRTLGPLRAAGGGIERGRHRGARLRSSRPRPRRRGRRAAWTNRRGCRAIRSRRFMPMPAKPTTSRSCSATAWADWWPCTRCSIKLAPRGLIASSPALATHAGGAQRALARALSGWWPGLTLRTGLAANRLSHDPPMSSASTWTIRSTIRASARGWRISSSPAVPA